MAENTYNFVDQIDSPLTTVCGVYFYRIVNYSIIVSIKFCLIFLGLDSVTNMYILHLALSNKLYVL